jgi:predicted ATPase/DNA-binding SARP family transcriptional activator
VARPVLLTNLPLALTSFVGRESEMANITRLLSTTRLLTLAGAGGSGKTRLALQVATDLLGTPHFPNGVWLVELAPLADLSHIPNQLASIFNIRESRGASLIDTLMDYLQAKQLLLVVDNCEHLIEACAQLVERLLRACPDLKVLATSREALAIPGEISYRVPSLTLPSSQQLPSCETLLTFEAIHLFVERATTAKPDFRLTDANASSIAHICERLDGMPLAIELAARRVKTLSPQQIVTRLDDRFPLLITGSRTALPRQQTLLATVEWSYNLLSEDEQCALCQLSVFAGGWTLEAAEAVIYKPFTLRSEDERYPPSTILDLLTRLIDKSLIIAIEQNGDERYHMLETIREYARTKFGATGDVESVRIRHLEFFCRWVEQVEPKLTTNEQILWLNRLEMEHGNLRTALAWSIENNQIELGLRLAAALTEFWYAHNHWSEGRHWLEETLARGNGASVRARAKALVNAAQLTFFQNEYMLAISHAEASLALYGALDDQRGIAHALWVIGFAFGEMGENTHAIPALEESLALRRQFGDKDEIAYSLHVLGELAAGNGEFDRAQSLFEESLDLFREQGDLWAIGLSLLSLGELRIRHGKLTQAESILAEGLTLFQQASDDRGIGLVLQHRAQVAQARGDPATAYTLYEQALASYYQVADKWALAWCIEALISLTVVQGKFAQAAQWMGGVNALREAIHSPIAPSNRVDYEKSVAAAMSALGKEAFDAAWKTGQGMSWERVVESAIAACMNWAKELTTLRTQREPTVSKSKPQPELTITALGQAGVQRGTHELALSDWTYAKARELFFFLLCSPPRTRKQIGLDLWFDASPAQLRSNLKVTLYHLRRALGRPDWILFEDDQYSFNRSLPYWFDVEVFDSDLAEARRLSTTAPMQAIELLEQALKLYQGDFLATWEKGEWYLGHQAELQRNYIEALMLLGKLRFVQERYDLAIEVYRRAIAKDSYLEAAHRELMRCLARQGEIAQAVRHFLELTHLLQDEMGAAPAPETQALYEKLKHGERI